MQPAVPGPEHSQPIPSAHAPGDGLRAALAPPGSGTPVVLGRRGERRRWVCFPGLRLGREEQSPQRSPGAKPPRQSQPGQAVAEHRSALHSVGTALPGTIKVSVTEPLSAAIRVSLPPTRDGQAILSDTRLPIISIPGCLLPEDGDAPLPLNVFPSTEETEVMLASLERGERRGSRRPHRAPGIR